MKRKNLLFGWFLFVLLAIGTNIYAQTPAAGDFVFNSNIGAWGTASNWNIANGDGTTSPQPTTTPTIPTYNDNVWIPVGDSVYIAATTYCKNVYVNGTLYTNSALGVNGNITVNSTGVFSLNSNVFCKNVYNYGKFWNAKSGYNSTKYLCIGYSNAGSTATNVASIDSCTIVNDGIFGWYRSASVSGSNGCGFFVEYSNQAKAVNITHSAGVTSGYIFTVNGLFPALNPSGAAASTAATQNLNLYINESMAVVASASPLEFSLQNGDTFTGYNRTCTIAANDTVFVAGYFHAKAAAPGASQGVMTYNIYGCLDMASCSRGRNEFDLYTSASSPSATVNVKSGGTLTLGLLTTLSASATTGQTCAINLDPNSIVKLGYTTANSSIALTNATLPTIPNLVVATGTKNFALGSALTVTNLTLTSGNLSLGNNNLTATSISGGSASSYILTGGTGKLNLTPAATTATLFPMGTATGYAPATLTTDISTPVSASVSTTSGAISGNVTNANEWTLTPTTTVNATVALAPTSALYGGTPKFFNGSTSGTYTSTTSATLTGGVYSASGVSLGTSATYLSTGSVTPTLLVSATSLSDLSYSTTTPQTFTVSGSNLGGNITITAPTGFVISSDGTTFSSSLILTPINYAVATTTIYARLTAGLSANPTAANITVATSGVTTANVAVTGTVTTTPTITVAGTLTSFSYAAGSGPSVGQTINVSGANLTTDITLTAPADYEISLDNTTYAASLTLSQTSGTVTTTPIYVRLKAGLVAASYSESVTLTSIFATTKTQAVTGTVTTPTITLGSSTLTVTSYIYTNGPVATSNTFTVAGTYLGDVITVTAPVDYEISTTNGGTYGSILTLTPASGIVASTTLYVRLKAGLAVGSYSESISVTSTSAITKTIALTGTVTVPTIAIIGTTLSGFSNITGNGSPVQKTFIVSGTNLLSIITVMAPGDYEISKDGITFSTTLTYTPTSNTVGASTIYARLIATTAKGIYNETITASATSATSQLVAVSGAVYTPTVTLGSTSLSGFSYIVGNGPSSAQTFTVSGTDLASSITLTAPTDYELSTDGTTFSTSLTLTRSTSTVVNSTIIYVRLKAGLSAADYNSETITITATSVSAQTVTLSGTVIVATDINTANTSNLLVYSEGKQVFVKNANVGDIVSVYGISGNIVASSVVTSDITTLSLTQGIYVVKVGAKVTKVLIK